jgi:hypothetical protein
MGNRVPLKGKFACLTLFMLQMAVEVARSCYTTGVTELIWDKNTTCKRWLECTGVPHLRTGIEFALFIEAL